MKKNLPYTIDQDEMTRRSFLKFVSGLLSFISGLVFATPFLGSLLSTTIQQGKSNFSKVGKVRSLTIGQPMELKFVTEFSDAYIHKTVLRDAWVIKHSATDITVFSPICTHLGCHYHWNPQSHHFECPCHGSIFSITGKVLGGPAPRPLDTLPAKIENGELFVEWQTYEVGIPQKKIV
jgi:menaquinol-cytochrome c reductase iron-sulfur subunit